MLSANKLNSNNLIAPLFICEGKSFKEEIKSMPDYYRLSTDLAVEKAKQLYDIGISTVCLFPVIPENKKDPKASEALNPKGFYPKLIKDFKKALPDMAVMTDVALDPYSSDGHDGLVKKGEILNDETLPILAEMAVLQAESGADIIGPSDMMDGRVAAIRKALDNNKLYSTSIMSYSAKYASAFYGPFRDALDSAPKSGDKKTYQMDYSNQQEALKEAKLDVAEGADIVMVKPGLSYLDVIALLKEKLDIPIAAYNVSGEYSMIKAAALEKSEYSSQSLFEIETEMMMNCLDSFKRAGADIILTYFAEKAARAMI